MSKPMKTLNRNVDLNYELAGIQSEATVNPIIRVFRALSIVSLIISYFALMTPFYPLYKIKPIWTKKHILSPILMILSRLVLMAFGYKVTKSGNFDAKEGTVVASNHLNAYLDMMIIWSVTKGSFLSTVEVQAMPLFGQIAELAGCIFIDRRTRENLPEEIAKVKEQLEQGINLIFFPEGRCHDGSEMLKFKKPFFSPATDREVDVQLVTMNYNTVSGQKITSENKSKILWYRQQKILPHLWNMLKYKSVEVHVTGDVMKASDYLANTEEHPAVQARNIMNSRFTPIK